MKTSNTTSLPIPLYRAVAGDPYSRGDADISVTSLLAPPRKVTLEEMHSAELVEDVADQAAQLIGKATHAYIAAAAVGEFDDARRLRMQVNGWVISGQTDHAILLPDGSYRIIDFKTVSTNEWKYGLKEERAQQLNCYATLFEANGYHVSSLAAILIMKDWSATQARFNADYPEHSIVEVPVPLWEREQAQSFITDRVAAHQAARRCETCWHTGPDHVVVNDPSVGGDVPICNACAPIDAVHNFIQELPDCTDDERWLRDAQYGVRKRGNTRATKNWPTEAEAKAHAAELNATSNVPYTVDFKPGSPLRCISYCTPGAMGFCGQYEQWKSTQEVEA